MNALSDPSISKEIPLTLPPDWSAVPVRQFQVSARNKKGAVTAYNYFFDSETAQLKYITIDGETFVIEVEGGIQERTFTDEDFMVTACETGPEDNEIPQIAASRFKKYNTRQLFP